MTDEVTAADARAFLGDFVADPTSLEGMPDADVLSLHGKVAAGVDKHAKPADWLSGADDATRAYVQNKAFGGPLDVVTGYRNLEKLNGVPAERIIKLPEQMTDAAAMRPVWERLGAGKTAEDYKLPVPEGDPGEYAKEAAKWMHELGIPVEAAVKLAERQNKYLADQKAALQTKQTELLATQEEALKVKWGADYDKNFTVAKGAAHALEWTKETVDQLESVLGFDGVLSLLHSIGVKFGEDRFVSGDGGRAMLNPSQQEARAQIAALKQDKGFAKKIANGDAEAKQKLQDLMKVAHPDMQAA